MKHMICSLMCLLACPALAWEFTSDPVCTVTDAGSATQVKMTFDGAIYTLELWHPEGWSPGPVFGIRFSPNGPLIQTDQHVITGQTLRVSDTGFSNVLRGLAGNTAALATLGDQTRDIDLTGAKAPVAAFAQCAPSIPMTSLPACCSTQGHG